MHLHLTSSFRLGEDCLRNWCLCWGPKSGWVNLTSHRAWGGQEARVGRALFQPKSVSIQSTYLLLICHQEKWGVTEDPCYMDQPMMPLFNSELLVALENRDTELYTARETDQILDTCSILLTEDKTSFRSASKVTYNCHLEWRQPVGKTALSC